MYTTISKMYDISTSACDQSTRAHLGESRPHRIYGGNSRWIRDRYHVWAETHAISILIMKVHMDLMSTSTSDPRDTLQIGHSRPERAWDVSEIPVRPRECVKHTWYQEAKQYRKDTHAIHVEYGINDCHQTERVPHQGWIPKQETILRQHKKTVKSDTSNCLVSTGMLTTCAVSPPNQPHIASMSTKPVSTVPHTSPRKQVADLLSYSTLG